MLSPSAMARQSAMHKVLIIQELLSTIFRFLDEGTLMTRPTLNALVQVCRTFHEPAMKELWHTQKSLLPIILVLLGGPIQVRDIPPDGEDETDDDELEDEDGCTHALYLGRDLTREDITLLYKYSQRVRELDVETGYKPYIIDDSVVQAFTDNIPCLFPKLTKFGWYTRTVNASLAQIMPFYRIVLGPDVKSIQLKGGLDSRFLGLIPKGCPNIETLAVEDYGEERYFYDIPPLRDTGFPFGWPRWCSLVTTLRKLSLCLLLDGGTNRSLWRCMPVWSLPIDSLHVESNDIRRVADFLVGARLENLTSIKIKLTHRPKLPKHTEIEDLFENIANACCSDKLEKICIFKGPFHRGIRSEDLRNKEPHIIQPSALKPLLQLTQIMKLKIHGPGVWYWDLDGTLVLELCKAWERLRTLILDPNDRWPSKSRITLNVLDTFIRHAPHLTEFGATIDATNAPRPRSMFNLPANDAAHQTALQKLRLNYSQIESAAHVTSFLCRRFPNLRKMEVEESNQGEVVFALGQRTPTSREKLWLHVASLLLPFHYLVAQEQLWIMADDRTDPRTRPAESHTILSRYISRSSVP